MDKTELDIEKYINDCATEPLEEFTSIQADIKQLAMNIRDIDDAREEYFSTVKEIKTAFSESDWCLLDKLINQFKNIHNINFNKDIIDSMEYHNSILLEDLADKMAEKIIEKSSLNIEIDKGLLK